MPTFVQKGVNANTGTASTTVAVTGLTAIGAGHLVCGMVMAQTLSATCTVKDGSGNSATMVPSSSGLNDTPNSNQMWMYYIAPSVETGGATTVTATFNSAQANTAITVQEWSGIQSTSPLDQSSLTNIAASTTPTGTSVTTTANGELCIACNAPDGGSPGTVTAGTNFAWTLRNSSASSLAFDESFVQSTAGAVAAGFKFTSSVSSQIGIMTFKAAATNNPFVSKFLDLPPAYYQTPNNSGSLITWLSDRTRFLVQQPASFFHNYDFPNPYPVTWYKDYSFSNVQFISQQPASFFRNNDQPNPYPVTWYRSWEQSLLTRPQTLPFNQKDWPNPYPVIWYRDWFNPAIKSVVQNPFRQSDWPVPQAPQYWDRFYSQSPEPPTPTAVISEFGWQVVPGPIFQVPSWTFSGNALTAVTTTPFAQFYWPVPIGNPRPDVFYSFSNVEQISQQPASFFHNYDFPNPQPITWYEWWYNTLPFGTMQKPTAQYDWPNPQPTSWYEYWYQALAPYFPNIQPFNQTDWPNPRGPVPIDQFWFNNIVELLSQANPLPFNQYDWPNPRTYPPIDQSFWQDIINLFPPPPPPVQQTVGSRTWTKEEWTRQLEKYVQQRQPPVIPELSKHFTKLSKLGHAARWNAKPA